MNFIDSLRVAENIGGLPLVAQFVKASYTKHIFVFSYYCCVKLFVLAWTLK
jgi:hypothetical protein